MTEFTVLETIRSILFKGLILLIVLIFAMMLGAHEYITFQVSFLFSILMMFVTLWADLDSLLPHDKDDDTAVEEMLISSLPEDTTFSALDKKAKEAVTNGDRTEFLLYQKKILLASYAVVIVYIASGETNKSKRIYNSALTCIASLDQQWSETHPNE